MLKNAFAIAALCIGALVVVGEVVYVQYISGHVIAKTEVYSRSNAENRTVLTVQEDDLPLRVILTARGEWEQRTRPGDLFADVIINFEGRAPQQTLRFSNSANQDSASLQANITMTQSFLLADIAPGELPLQVELNDFRSFQIKTVYATFRGGGRAMSLAILGVGGLFFIIGLLAFVYRSRD